MTTPAPTVSANGSPDDGMGDLAVWAKGFAQAAQAPAGQPNLVAENMTLIAAHLQQYSDYCVLTNVVLMLKNSVGSHNAECKTRCTARRADTAAPCGGTAEFQCEDCPRRMGLVIATKSLAG